MIDFASDYIGYVLSAYGIAALVLLGVVVSTLAKARSLKRTLADMKLSDPGQSEKP